MRPTPKRKIPIQGTRRRCAIYTRKSSEEGLEQAFNSLDAQREACEAYIRSQRHEGWELLPTFYDDGGISGGTLDRPALRQLLADIKAGQVDLVVVYKVDRLTRSLADFAKIVEVIDAQGASFVSVTQQFNTSTSMGRLTLNMLLSFAQFEREVTGERIRDKIAASKRKGMWMGGQPPLGYDVKDRKLAIVPAEADTVRYIFGSYLRLGSVRLLQEQLAAEGVRSKLRPTASSPKMRGGRVLPRGALYLMLQNRLYRGEVQHGGSVYAGEHPAIVDPALWEAVQRQLAANRVERRSGARAVSPSLLAGLVYDDGGERLVPSHAVKGDRRYRYYVAKPAPRDGTPSAVLRIPAADLERVVTERLRAFLADPSAVFAAIRGGATDAAQQRHLIEEAAELAVTWSARPGSQRRDILQRLVHRITVHRDRIDIQLRPGQLHTMLTGAAQAPETEVGDAHMIHLSAPVTLKRAGLEVRMVMHGTSGQPEQDGTLIKLIVRAQALREKLLQDDLSIGQLAEHEGVTSSYITRVLRLAFLAPDITAAILDGQQPRELTAHKLLRDSRLPIAWPAQRQALGFG